MDSSTQTEDADLDLSLNSTEEQSVEASARESLTQKETHLDGSPSAKRNKSETAMSESEPTMSESEPIISESEPIMSQAFSSVEHGNADAEPFKISQPDDQLQTSAMQSTETSDHDTVDSSLVQQQHKQDESPALKARARETHVDVETDFPDPAEDQVFEIDFNENELVDEGPDTEDDQ